MVNKCEFVVSFLKVMEGELLDHLPDKDDQRLMIQYAKRIIENTCDHVTRALRVAENREESK